MQCLLFDRQWSIIGFTAVSQMNLVKVVNCNIGYTIDTIDYVTRIGNSSRAPIEINTKFCGQSVFRPRLLFAG